MPARMLIAGSALSALAAVLSPSRGSTATVTFCAGIVGRFVIVSLDGSVLVFDENRPDNRCRGPGGGARATDTGSVGIESSVSGLGSAFAPTGDSEAAPPPPTTGHHCWMELENRPGAEE